MTGKKKLSDLTVFKVTLHLKLMVREDSCKDVLTAFPALLVCWKCLCGCRERVPVKLWCKYLVLVFVLQLTYPPQLSFFLCQPYTGGWWNRDRRLPFPAMWSWCNTITELSTLKVVYHQTSLFCFTEAKLSEEITERCGHKATPTCTSASILFLLWKLRSFDVREDIETAF